MRKKPLIVLFFLLLAVLSISDSFSKKIRYTAIATISPIGQFFTKKSRSYEEYGSLKNLKVENELLKEERKRIYEWMMFDRRIEENILKLQKIENVSLNQEHWKKFYQRRAGEIKKILKMQLQAVPAKIIYREPVSWSSSIWVNVGKRTNRSLKKKIISKNSPVVLEDALIGVVEYVGEKFSRIRLITDSGLFPSVRALRGEQRDNSIAQIAILLYEMLQSRGKEMEKPLLNNLLDLASRLKRKEKDVYLAKGEINGSSYPLWRSYGQKLKGRGFNYDFPDEETSFQNFSRALLKKGDLLITTGMDGIFPAGLKVGIVSKVERKEGSFYNIESISFIKNFQNLSVVFILPSLDFSKKEL